MSSDRGAGFVHSRSTTSHRGLDMCARHRVHQLGLQRSVHCDEQRLSCPGLPGGHRLVWQPFKRSVLHEVQGSSTVSQSCQPESLRSGSGSVQNSKFSGVWCLLVVGMGVWAELEARGQLSWTNNKHSHQGFQTLCHATEAGRVDSMSLSSRTTVSQTCARSNFPGEVLCTINSTSM